MTGLQRFLLVEDSADDAALIERQIVTRRGPCFCHRVDTMSALSAALAEPWTAVLVDMNVPGTSGLEALRLLASQRPFLPAIMVSGSTGEQVLVEAAKAGASEFVGKDELDRLVPAIERACRDAEARRQHAEVEARFRDTFEQTAVGILHTSLDGTILRANMRYSAMLGFGPDELCGLNVKDVTHPDDRILDAALVDALSRAGSSLVLEKRYRRRDGEFVWCLTTLSLASGIHAEPYVIAIVQDVSDRVEATRRLRESELRYRELMEQAPDAIFISTPEGRFLNVNSRACELTGYTREELLRLSIPDLVADAVRFSSDALCSGQTRVAERRIRTAGGNVVPVEVSAKMLADGCLQGIVRDVTEKKRTEELLRRSEERLRLLVRHSRDVISILSPDGTVQFMSDAVETVLGYRADELTGAQALEIIHPDDRELIRGVLGNLLEAPDGSAPVEYRIRTKEGSWRWIQSVGRNLLHVAGIEGIVVNSRDVTEHRAWERRLAQSEQLASLGRLAATIAHEFNNVLMGIQPFAELLRRRFADESSVVNACSHIENSIRRGRGVTQDILRFANAAEPAIAPVDARQWIEEMAEELRGLLGARARLQISCGAPGLRIAADRQQLAQAVTNLVLNARDAMPQGGTVSISIDEGTPTFGTPAGLDPSAFVHLSVADEGCGIPPALQAQIFEPLFTTKPGGTGLGLPIVHQIVTRHGGHVWLESAPGRGTRFHLLIPRDESGAVSESSPARSASLIAGRRVLVVEDEAAVAEGLLAILTMEGCDVEIVNRGADAEGAIRTFEPDVIVLDVGLPDCSGIELHQRLAASMPLPPVVFSTGHAEQPESAQLPGVRFLAKPYSSDALLDLIAELTGADVLTAPLAAMADSRQGPC